MGIGIYSSDKREGLTVKQVQCPWKDYDPSCEGPGFFPITPSSIDIDNFNEYTIIDEIKKIIEKLEKDDLIPRYRMEQKWRLVKLANWLYQLHGYPGSVPDRAGKEYSEWVESLRKR